MVEWNISTYLILVMIRGYLVQYFLFWFNHFLGARTEIGLFFSLEFGGFWGKEKVFVCLLFVTDERYYAFLNANKLWRTIALIYVNVGQYYKVSQRTSDQEKEKVFWDFQTFRHCTLGESRIYVMIRELGGHERCDWVQTTAIIIVSQCPVLARGS